MDLQRLWAPWRYDYVSGSIPPEELPVPPEPDSWLAGANQECFLCCAAAVHKDPKSADEQTLTVWRDNTIIVVLNRFPYSNGHLLISPCRHVAELNDLTNEEHLESMRMLGRLCSILKEAISADGFNVGLNLGDVAGAGVPGHLHWHLVPRWAGDHNFMAATSNTRVIAQSLQSLWQLLSAELRVKKA